MHEYSIVQALLEQCQTHVQANDATKITAVTVKIGVQSGIELHLFEVAFDTFKEKTICDEANLIIEHQLLLIYCSDCDQEYTLEKLEYICPKCQSLHIEVVDGEDMYLMRLEME